MKDKIKELKTDLESERWIEYERQADEENRKLEKNQHMFTSYVLAHRN